VKKKLQLRRKVFARATNYSKKKKERDPVKEKTLLEDKIIEHQKPDISTSKRAGGFVEADREKKRGTI